MNKMEGNVKNETALPGLCNYADWQTIGLRARLAFLMYILRSRCRVAMNTFVEWDRTICLQQNSRSLTKPSESLPPAHCHKAVQRKDALQLKVCVEFFYLPNNEGYRIKALLLRSSQEAFRPCKEASFSGVA